MNKHQLLYTCIEWAMKCSLSIRFFKQRTVVQTLYCCTFESKIGTKIKSYEIKEYSLNACLHHIIKNYKDIFLELNCPPIPISDIMKE